MDCRAPLFVALLGVVVATGAGCTPQGAPLVSSSSRAESPPALGEGKRIPKPATCVAAGDFHEQQAAGPDVSPADQSRLRETARKAYQQAISIDPDYVPAYQALAHLYTVMGDHQHALATYQKILKKHPKDAVLWYDLGMCQSQHKEWDAALESLRKAVELDPENRPYISTLAYGLARAGRFDESLGYFKRVGSPASAHYNVARMQHHLKLDDLCQHNLAIAVQLDPQLNDARQMLVQLQSGDKAAEPVTRAGYEEREDVKR
jgi:tetratricopeptide (TPR) repeat protein